ncbi:MAG: hypothetical protein KF764_22585 [Labilithrix sp.]|nr:hypothetical protein [Labilithrix sp.]
MTTAPRGPASFDDDLAFLNAHGKTLVLTDPDGAQVALSALYQGRVMTSAVSASGRSLGWINRTFIEAGKTGTPFDNFGGEDRFWLGPEGGQFGLYFPPGGPFTFDAWQTPHAMQEGAWDVAEERADRVVFKRSMTVTSWSKTELSIDVERAARLLSRADAKKLLGPAAAPGKDVGFVAFETKNAIVNAGKAAWKRDKGLVSIWILAMFAPAADARVVIPFEKTAPSGTEIVNDRYFGKVPADRLAVDADAGFLSFKADGKERGKIGLGPARAKSVLGSYSAEAKLLTIVHYDGPKKGAPYVNSMWEAQKKPYAGDVVNSYNDGPPAPGKPPLGGFYEIETSSPGAELAPGKSLVHTHRTFHFVGEPDALDPIAKEVLGVSLRDIAK